MDTGIINSRLEKRIHACAVAENLIIPVEADPFCRPVDIDWVIALASVSGCNKAIPGIVCAEGVYNDFFLTRFNKFIDKYSLKYIIIMNMKESIYIETSVVSYYTSKPSRDLIALAHQQITRDWWPVATDKFSVHISQVVLEEAKMGDAILAKMRLESVKKFKVLKLTEEVEKLASVYIKKLSIPPKALRDSAHLAVASCNKIDYLVTWNCKHLANAEIIKKLIAINNQLGMHTPIICTPEELMEA